MSNALKFSITMCLKYQEEVTNPPIKVNLIDDDYGIVFELSLFATNIKKEICGVLESFLSFLKRYEKIKPHNILCFMLDPRFKSPCLVFYFIGYEEGVNIVEEYDIWSLYCMFLKCCHYLLRTTKSKVGYAYQTIHANFDFDILNKLLAQVNQSQNLSPKNCWFFECYQRNQMSFSMVGKT